MKKTVCILILLIVGIFPVLSQRVLLDEEVTEDFTEENYGPNEQSYTHTFFDVTFFIDKPENDSAAIKYGHSGSFTYGIRQKYKIFSFLAFGFEGYYSFFSYYLKQEDKKILPNQINHDKEKLVVHNFGVSAYTRINVGRRGNTIGNYIDLGAYGNWAFYNMHITKDKINYNDPNHADKIKQKNSGLDYMEQFNYGVQAAIGKNHFAVTGRYRLSDLFTSDYPRFPELPRLTVGVQINLY